LSSLPWGKWEWGDWMRDAGVRASSYAARGLWMDMLCHMAASPETGFLLVGNRAATPAEIARIVGGERRTVERLLQELRAHGVYSTDHRGAIFNRRMVRDYVKLQQDIANGKRGGNPNLKKSNDLPENKVNPPVKADKEEDKIREENSKNPLPPTGVALSPIEFDPIAEAVQIWNATCCPELPAVSKITDQRKRALMARLKADFGGDLGEWRCYCIAIMASDFLVKGKKWRASFDWAINPTNMTKVLEGNYANKANGPGTWDWVDNLQHTMDEEFSP